MGSYKDYSVDIWSIGCIIGELVYRKPIFIGNNDNDQLFAYMEYLGCPPDHMISQSRNRYNLFDYNGIPVLPRNRVLNSKKLSDIISDNLLLKLINRCLSWDPKNRITCNQGIYML